jgi:dephospho-CoA kinase
MVIDSHAVPVIGLTGGIACGKSTVSRMFAELGARIVDADQVARAVVEPGTPGLAAVFAAFGDAVQQADGTLDRKALGQVIFHDEAARARLNAIVHPRMAQVTAARIAAARAEGPPCVIYDAALLIEMGHADAFRPLVVVHLPAEAQRARLMARDGLSAPDAQARMDSQMPLADKLALADHAIDNSGTRAQTRRQVEQLFEELCS